MAVFTDKNDVFDLMLDRPLDIQELPREQKSVIEQLLDELQSHEQGERELLREYEKAANETTDRGVAFLMGLILEDEHRHHRLVDMMRHEVEQSLLWLQGEEPLPPVGAGKRSPQLLQQTNAFLEVERESLKQLEDLRRKVKGLQSGLLELLVNSMTADTKKHVDILKYIRKRLQAAKSA